MDRQIPIILLNLAYAEAIEKGYLWHEFGDLHLILPQRFLGHGHY
jgi:S-adenosylmethionine:tRNA-ribosyltransferase-isomerase (queuine synthetase)